MKWPFQKQLPVNPTEVQQNHDEQRKRLVSKSSNALSGLSIDHADFFRRTRMIRVVESLKKEKESCDPSNKKPT